LCPSFTDTYRHYFQHASLLIGLSDNKSLIEQFFLSAPLLARSFSSHKHHILLDKSATFCSRLLGKLTAT
ncbi:hypothetical protein IJI99_02620, partial [bacterium]|nr:hypothetical protein [bacterium]